MDDGYAVAAGDVFPALERFRLAVRDLDLVLQVAKFLCYSPAVGSESCEQRPSAYPVGQVVAADTGNVGYGSLVGGVPVGDVTYVNAKLGKKVAGGDEQNGNS